MTVIWVVATFTCALHVNADILYNITFSQFTNGQTYTVAGGPIDDFSDYSRGYSETATIVGSFLGLNDQPLVNYGVGASSRSTFTMDFAGSTNVVLALSLDISLGTNGVNSGPLATIRFSSDVVAGTQTVVSMLLGWQLGGALEATSVQVVSLHGSDWSSASLVWANSASFSREQPLSLSLTLDTLTRTFHASLGGQELASNAPFGNLPISSASITLGDVITVEAGGHSAIDNILLTATVIPEPSVGALLLAGGFCLWRVRRTIASNKGLVRTGGPRTARPSAQP